jgi:hypothetical protein
MISINKQLLLGLSFTIPRAVLNQQNDGHLNPLQGGHALLIKSSTEYAHHSGIMPKKMRALGISPLKVRFFTSP